MDIVGDDILSFCLFSLFSPLPSFYYTSPLSLSPLFLFLISTLFNSLSLYPLRLSSPLPKKKSKKMPPPLCGRLVVAVVAVVVMVVVVVSGKS